MNFPLQVKNIASKRFDLKMCAERPRTTHKMGISSEMVREEIESPDASDQVQRSDILVCIRMYSPILPD